MISVKGLSYFKLHYTDGKLPPVIVRHRCFSSAAGDWIIRQRMCSVSCCILGWSFPAGGDKVSAITFKYSFLSWLNSVLSSQPCRWYWLLLATVHIRTVKSEYSWQCHAPSTGCFGCPNITLDNVSKLHSQKFTSGCFCVLNSWKWPNLEIYNHASLHSLESFIHAWTYNEMLGKIINILAASWYTGFNITTSWQPL